MSDLARSRLKVGVDVPWVTSWSGEEISGVGRCASVGGEVAVLQGERPEYGRPIYSKNHFRRQRVSVQKMLCPMCGKATREGDRWSQTGRFHPAGVLRARGLAISVPPAARDEQIVLDAGAIAPGHLACMTRSREQCPHLRGLEEQELKPFPERWHVTATLLNAIVTSGGPVPGSRTVPAIGFLQLSGITAAVDRDWRSMLV